MRTFFKDAASSLDWAFDWSVWLDSGAGEAITSSTVTVDPGLTLSSSAFNGTQVTVWLTGGTAGRKYKVTSSITTSAGRSEEKSFLIQVTD